MKNEGPLYCFEMLFYSPHSHMHTPMYILSDYSHLVFQSESRSRSSQIESVRTVTRLHTNEPLSEASLERAARRPSSSCLIHQRKFHSSERDALCLIGSAHPSLHPLSSSSLQLLFFFSFLPAYILLSRMRM